MHQRLLMCAIGAVLVACGKAAVQSTPSTAPAARASSAPAGPMTTATAIIRDVAGTQIGSATFTDSRAGVLVDGTVSGLGLGSHGVHIHETGKCDAPFATAGGHFNPEKVKHGFKSPDGPHLGDLPNIDMPGAGRLRFEFVLPGVTLKGGGTNALLDADGAAIVIHATRDDYATDPSGGSGGRLACGVIIGR